MFRSHQTILRELSCLVVKLLRADYFCTSLVMQQHACNNKVCLKPFKFTSATLFRILLQKVGFLIYKSGILHGYKMKIGLSLFNYQDVARSNKHK